MKIGGEHSDTVLSPCGEHSRSGGATRFDHTVCGRRVTRARQTKSGAFRFIADVAAKWVYSNKNIQTEIKGAGIWRRNAARERSTAVVPAVHMKFVTKTVMSGLLCLDRQMIKERSS